MWPLAAMNTQFKPAAILGLGLALAVNTALVCAQDPSASEQYAKILAEADSLAAHNQLLTQQLKSQDSELVVLQQQVAGLDATAAAVTPLIKKMYDSLQAFVSSDLPFIDPTQAGPDTRKERMERLRNLMASDTSAEPDQAAPAEGAQAAEAQSEESIAAAEQEAAAQAQKERARNAERYRRLLEAYQIELDYGRTMAAYKGKLEDGRDADFVRVGRVSLLYRTSDGDEAGYWDTEQKKWVVDNDYNKAVEKAVLIATKESAPDLVIVPVPAPQEMPL